MIFVNRFLSTNQTKVSLLQNTSQDMLDMVSNWNPWLKIIKYRNIF